MARAAAPRARLGTSVIVPEEPPFNILNWLTWR